jgi:tRNA-modifying protein YgfZ
VLISASFDPDCHRTIENEYEMIRTGAGKYLNPLTILSLSGNDVLDLLQRITTNDLADLKTGSVRSTILVTEKAKIKSVVTLLITDEHVLMLSEWRDAKLLKQWIEQYVIMEDVQITNLSQQYSSMTIMGQLATEHLEAIYTQPKAVIFQTHERYFTTPYGYLMRNPLWQMPCYSIIERKTTAINFETGNLISKVGEETYELARIENGVPKMGKELSDDVNPLEANLWHLVSFSKGCYIGQEVIARLDTYKKLQKKLVGLIIDSEDIELTGAQICLDDSTVGSVTSSAWSYSVKSIVALGYLKASVSGNCELRCVLDGKSNKTYPARIVPIPIL